MIFKNKFLVIFCFLGQFTRRASIFVVRDILIRWRPLCWIYYKMLGRSKINIPNNLKTPEVTPHYREFFEKVLLDSFFAPHLQKGSTINELKGDILDHVENRYLNFRDNLIPWVQKCQPDMSYMNVIEIGSGTGSSTLAICPYVKTVTCFEIDDVANSAALKRLKYFDINNCTIRSELFSSQSRFIQSNKIHAVFLCAVLEHMIFFEVREVLKTAWSCLTPGGILVVADTPNRLNFIDRHTSLLPFFSMLPVEIRREYATFSPRNNFKDEIAHTTDDNYIHKLARWGNGISYHDFELSIGRDFHKHIVLDGYELELRNCAPVLLDDIILQSLFIQNNVSAHKAFTRSNLYFIARKP